MVDEQSSLIGTTKALGMYGQEIMWKYFFYGSQGTVLGMVLGILAAYFVLQPALLKMYGSYFNITPVPRCFLTLLTLSVFSAVWFFPRPRFSSPAANSCIPRQFR